ncbi:sigma factor-like helix-turn-helix DNA-binding protein [Saccharopolyspora shandongensis]|uniref:RNA polymerase sigma factor n=1 Tax=Saccharopolyspora shandongensis TaxID=418495 RepID=UPI00342480A7
MLPHLGRRQRADRAVLEKLEAERPEMVEALVLRDICGLAYADITTQLELPEGTVKSQIHGARARMRELMTQHAHG